MDEQRSAEIQRALCFYLANKENLPPIARKRLSRALAHFNVKTQITYNEDNLNHHTRLFLVTNDRPGLLATISRVFLTLNFHLHNAKIVTTGELVEDMFYITYQPSHPLNSEEKETLREQLIHEI